MSYLFRPSSAGRVIAIGLAAALSLGLPSNLASAQQSTSFQSTRPKARPSAPSDYWRPRQDEIRARLLNEISFENYKLVFIGDSITDFWATSGRSVWNDSFSGTNPANLGLNLGLAGDRTEHVLYRILPSSEGGLGELDRADLNPEMVVLLVGINNTWDAEEPVAQSVFQGIRTVVEQVHQQKPAALVVLQSLLPTNDPHRNATIVVPVNRALAQFASRPEQAGYVRFLDLYPSFSIASGRQNSALFVDGIHPNESGYRAWRDQLVPFLAAVRGAEGSVSPNLAAR